MLKLLPPGKVGEMKLRGGIGEEGVKFKLANERAPVRPLKGCGAPKLLLGISSGLVKPLVTVGIDTSGLLTVEMRHRLTRFVYLGMTRQIRDRALLYD